MSVEEFSRVGMDDNNIFRKNEDMVGVNDSHLEIVSGSATLHNSKVLAEDSTKVLMLSAQWDIHLVESFS